MHFYTCLDYCLCMDYCLWTLLLHASLFCGYLFIHPFLLCRLLLTLLLHATAFFVVRCLLPTVSRKLYFPIFPLLNTLNLLLSAILHLGPSQLLYCQHHLARHWPSRCPEFPSTTGYSDPDFRYSWTLLAGAIWGYTGPCLKSSQVSCSRTSTSAATPPAREPNLPHPVLSYLNNSLPLFLQTMPK